MHVYSLRLSNGHAAWGPPINVLTDSVAFVVRTELAGEPRRDDLWQEISQFASTFFAKPGVSFADAHAAISHAMAGDDEALAKLREKPAGPAGDLVKGVADVFAAFVRFDWQAVVDGLTPLMATHERLGGSRVPRRSHAGCLQNGGPVGLESWIDYYNRFFIRNEIHSGLPFERDRKRIDQDSEGSC